ncbi:transcriptional regulator [Paractinoplanes deccanensis]|uniref:Transcriptional regulator n=1 Tax=Paractinoplanes deccanensis TaxID=113561 RepID=A0ABQ3Y1B2_9ACTN|nr:LuxR C-terminal-related transcriptional regulator [Actinoplanes deccanensis]GID73793.1 transcriptional regulator [Actinoplanes deccanensis]
MTELIGRENELRTLEALLDPDRRDAAAIAVTASRGRGTTSLLAEAADRAARRGFRVLRATGHRDEQDLDGMGLHQLLRPLRPLANDLSEEDRRDADPVLALRSRDPEVLGAGARALLAAAASRGPVLAVVDDLHLIDRLSADVLRGLVDAVVRRPVVFLLGVRARHAAGVRSAGVAVLPLDPLSPEAAAELLGRQPAVPRGRGRLEILRWARGNPRAILDLAVAFAGATSDEVLRPTLERALPIRERHAADLAQLPPAVLRLVRQVSARAGDESLGQVLAAAQVSDGDLRLALDLGVLERHGHTLRLADPLAGIAAYCSCPAVERTGLHRRFAAVLPPDSLAHARHLAAEATGPDETIAAALEKGAGGRDAAALQNAAELSPNPADAARRYAAAIEAASATGQTTWVLDLHAALAALDQEAALAPATARTVALAHSRQGRQRAAMDLLAESCRRRPPRTSLDALLMAAAAANVSRLSGLPEHRATVGSLARLADALPATGTGDGEAGELRLLRAAVEAAADPYICSLPLSMPPPEDPTRATLLAYLADAAGDLRTATTLRAGALETVRRAGDLAGVAEARLPYATNLGDQGRWREATEVLAEGRRLCALADLPLLEWEVTLQESVMAALLGDATRSRELAEPAWNGIDLHQNRRLRYYLEVAAGNAAFAEGDFALAYRHFQVLFDAGRFHPDAGAYALLGLAVMAPHAGREAEGAELVAGYPLPGRARMRLLAAHARAALTDDERTEERFRVAVGDPEGEAWAFERALARLHYGAWLRRKRRPLEARAQLCTALRALEAMGSGPHAEIARTELAAAGEGADPVPAAGDPLGRLSPQQRQIVQLAARGLRNREIAAQLRVSPRTVGTHLYNAYPKLGVSGRRELGSLLAG